MARLTGTLLEVALTARLCSEQEGERFCVMRHYNGLEYECQRGEYAWEGSEWHGKVIVAVAYKGRLSPDWI